MRKYVLDTSILLHYVRHSDLARQVEDKLSLLAKDAVPIIASVTVGEMQGFVQRQQWGASKVKRLKKLVEKMILVDIAAVDDELMNAYATIWNYSKNTLPGNKLGHSIGIGQNDVWIAALARAAKAELVTTDGDFSHLNDKWITVHTFKTK